MPKPYRPTGRKPKPRTYSSVASRVAASGNRSGYTGTRAGASASVRSRVARGAAAARYSPIRRLPKSGADVAARTRRARAGNRISDLNRLARADDARGAYGRARAMEIRRHNQVLFAPLWKPTLPKVRRVYPNQNTSDVARRRQRAAGRTGERRVRAAARYSPIRRIGGGSDVAARTRRARFASGRTWAERRYGRR